MTTLLVTGQVTPLCLETTLSEPPQMAWDVCAQGSRPYAHTMPDWQNGLRHIDDTEIAPRSTEVMRLLLAAQGETYRGFFQHTLHAGDYVKGTQAWYLLRVSPRADRVVVGLAQISDVPLEDRHSDGDVS